MKPIENITIVGTGNVAVNLLDALISRGFNITEVIGRSDKQLQHIQYQYRVPVNTNLKAIDVKSDLLVLAITDDAIEVVAQKLNPLSVPVVHTAGSVSMDVFIQTGFPLYGVFYPLQTFTKTRLVDFSNVPLFIEANTQQFEIQLMNLAKKLSSNVQSANSMQRAMLHVAAVFACNFSNHMMAVAHKLTMENNLDFNALLPLIKETLEKAIALGPEHAQTGPAIRKNQQVLLKHDEILQDEPHLQEIYRLLSNSIQRFHTKHRKE